MNATKCYGVTELGRCEIDGVEYVAYDDGQYRYAVLASDYDDVRDEPRDDTEWRANAYSEWCSRCTSVSRDVTAAVARDLEWMECTARTAHLRGSTPPSDSRPARRHLRRRAITTRPGRA
jgi:hypothetical protein